MWFGPKRDGNHETHSAGDHEKTAEPLNSTLWLLTGSMAASASLTCASPDTTCLFHAWTVVTGGEISLSQEESGLPMGEV